MNESGRRARIDRETAEIDALVAYIMSIGN